MFLIATVMFIGAAGNAHAQATGQVSGRVFDQTGAALPGVVIDLIVNARELPTTTDESGRYRFDEVPAGTAELTFRSLNYSVFRRTVGVTGGASSPPMRR